jgi:type IV secretion system protein TrbL
MLKVVAIVLGTYLILYSLEANAVDSKDVLDTILDKYHATASKWAATITAHASKLFWELALISMVWTFGFMALRKADIGEFFAELVRFTIFTGFFWWLLINGPNFANSLIDSMRQMGGEATGLGSSLSPSTIVDVGFMTLDKAVSGSAILTPVDSAVGIVIAVIILVIIALIAVNMLMLLVSAWILSYAGIFFLGFGGSRWTSEIAIHYYKTVLGIATQLFAMVLIIGIGQSFLNDYYIQIGNQLIIKDYAVMLVASIVLLVLSNKIPSMLSGIITGSGIGHIGIGNFGAGAAVGAVGAAAATAIAGAKEAAGGAQAVIAAAQMAQEHRAEGSGAFKVSGAGGFGSNSGSGGLIGGLSSAIGNNILTGLDVVSNLAQAGKSVASDHVKDSTLGGKLASAMGDPGAKDNNADTKGGKNDSRSFDGNSIGAGKQESMPLTGVEEIDNFVNKNS